MMSKQKDRQELNGHIREELQKYASEGNRYLLNNTPVRIEPKVRVISAHDVQQQAAAQGEHQAHQVSISVNA